MSRISLIIITSAIILAIFSIALLQGVVTLLLLFVAFIVWMLSWPALFPEMNYNL